MQTLISIFLAMHGLVHLWFVVLSLKLVKFKSVMGWTGQSLILSNYLSSSQLSNLSAVLFTFSTLLFLVASFFYGFNISGWRKMINLASIFSLFTIILFWDGVLTKPVEKGLIGFLINLVLIIFVT